MIANIEHNKTLNTPQIAKLREQAEGLEGVFLNTLVKEMFSSIKTDKSSFGGGFAEQTWRGMQAEQYSNAMAQAGGIGLADQLMPGLIAMQEAAQNPINKSNTPIGAYSK
ncbi:rod-binding protein [Devosia rhodophyticola]|uniref:Rod-binding protein n=1 Tax=Devosia rhodophyticola TaxID=3026423 RepID=A0ABY7YW07_9HYPH|nr:rod-binding protein [Devosia rhodophyticola]WDR05416.1 rod-binding protein [Devosia rhodophyticola]